MNNIRLLLEYDGSKFHGWQKQPHLRTIQAELEKVINLVTGSKIRALTASGRTDAGLHAKGQACNFLIDGEVDLQRLKNSVSSLMKGELSVLSAEYIDKDFNACRDAVCKQYTYTILNRQSPAVLDYGRVWHIAGDLNVELMSIEAQRLAGVHDFKSFQASGCAAKTSIKEIISSQLKCEPPYIRYVVVGRGFLKQMVRNIVGTLVAFSQGKLEDKNIIALLERCDRRYAGPTAPAHALCLDWVRYDDEESLS